MARTNIDIDDELIAEAMRRYGLRTKREAVDLALRRLVGPRLSPEFLDSIHGMGWDEDGTVENMHDEIAVIDAVPPRA